MSRISFVLFFFGCFTASGQINPEKLALGRMDRGKWQKAEQSLRKSLARDSLNPEARYLLSLYFFASGNPSSNLDSAYVYAKSSTKHFQRSSAKDRERLKKIPLDSLELNSLVVKIDSASFEKAKRLNTGTAYQYFIDHHPFAPQRSSAVELRDEVAFLEALKLNTWNSFQTFMTRYPSSHRRKEAEGRFDKLLFEDKTKGQRLVNYIEFYRQFPESPYRPIVEKNIFELSTASGSVASFRWFVENYPKSKWSGMAMNILYKLLPAEEENVFDVAWMTDSLKQVDHLNKLYWVPVYKSKLYGFMDEQGTEVIAPTFENIQEKYRCGEVRDRLLATSQGLVARNGAILWKGVVLGVQEIGSGYIVLAADSGNYVLHESGFRIEKNTIDDAQVIANNFIGVRKDKKWAVRSLAGKAILPFLFDEIATFDSLIILNRGGKKILTTPARLGRLADKGEFKEDFVFDDVRRWDNQLYWVRNGNLEGVLDARLNFVIPLDRQILRKTSFGFLRGKDDKLFIKGIPRLEAAAYKVVNEQAGWVHMQTEDDGQLLYDKGLDLLHEGDTAWLQGQLAFLRSGDSVSVFLPSGQKLSFLNRASFQFKEYRDSVAWLVLDEKKKKVIIDAASGVKLFTMEVDQIEPVTPAIFLVSRMNKRGLVAEDGKVLVPIEFDAIVAVENNSFSLFRDKKFGWYDATTKLLIKPTFERNLKPYSNSLRLAFKEKGYGLILPNGKPLGAFEWEEIQYWNDSTAWVKKNFQWILFEIYSQKVKLGNVRDFSVVCDLPAEKIYILHQENAFGVISNRRGIVVPMQYSDIVNLGSKEVPLYFTERHIEEAGISVVVYYDSHGKIIRKQAMEADEFEKIYCGN